MVRAFTHMRISRRRCAFWLGFGLFSLSEALGIDSLDRAASAAMRATDSDKNQPPPEKPSKVEHWTASENNTWAWFERENLVDGHWKLTGITTPIHKRTGERHQGPGYLDDGLVPEAVRRGDLAGQNEPLEDGAIEDDPGKPSPMRRARHGRPPSRWLRSLYADELHVWLATIDVPEAGVEGMTFWEHLTRDHAFNSRRIAGLSLADQAKLHAAAHAGY